jgi:tetrahydromethanopterin S-methyltransferase subunit G
MDFETLLTYIDNLSDEIQILRLSLENLKDLEKRMDNFEAKYNITDTPATNLHERLERLEKKVDNLELKSRTPVDFLFQPAQRTEHTRHSSCPTESDLHKDDYIKTCPDINQLDINEQQYY